MTDRLTVDIDALRGGGVNIEETARLAQRIYGDLRSVVFTLGGAGGTGEMGEKFDQGYKPGEEEALRFLALLVDVLGEAGGRTFDTARVFVDTSNEADSSVRNQ
ncbi:aldo/keto reductase [Actinokineospora sp. UTMC 2448]|uniref:aldo/keto reductase n=1 Tax=Actinokineospora sp. UTMC 2448 TaxID=2268449 RepID=UPI00216477F3|nr:aldo/keto reductase [Actinokineospora sp. UTMC 2448]